MAVLHGSGPGRPRRGDVMVRVGQELGGFVLRAVHDRGVTLYDGREQFDLELPEPGLATTAADQG
jgi:hypothetical protein